MSGTIRFIYTNSKRQTKEQTITNYRDKGDYFSGFSEAHGMVRTFRKDRVEAWLDGAEFIEQATTDERPLSVLFTGFSESERNRLETFARQDGFRIRKTVSKTLDFLCTGTRPSIRKKEQAEDCGVLIMTADEFTTFLDTGALPDMPQLDEHDDTEPVAAPTAEPRPSTRTPQSAQVGMASAVATPGDESPPPSRGKKAQKRRLHWPSFIWGFVFGWGSLIVLALFAG